MNPRRKPISADAVLGLHAALKVATGKPFRVAGHLWFVRHCVNFLAACRYADKASEQERQQLLAAATAYLELGEPSRRALKIETFGDPKHSDELKRISAAIRAAVTCIQRAESGIAGSRPMSAQAVQDVLTLIEAHRKQSGVAVWLERACGELRQIGPTVASDRLSNVSRGEGAARQTILELRRAELTLGELHRIQTAFEAAVVRLPSFTAKDAAEFIGLTVDRVHRMAALGEIDTFYIRRRIPKSEIRRRGKGGKGGVKPYEEAPRAPDVTDKICDSLANEAFGIPQLVKFQAGLVARIERISVSLKAGIERMGFSEVYVHSMLRRGELLSFGIPRLVPRSEADRLRRNPNERHLGRPRISESGGT